MCFYLRFSYRISDGSQANWCKRASWLRDLWPYYSNKNGQQNESKGHDSSWCAEQHIPPHSINLLNQYIHEQADNIEEQCESRTFLRSFQVVLLMSCVRLSKHGDRFSRMCPVQEDAGETGLSIQAFKKKQIKTLRESAGKSKKNQNIYE